MSFAWNSQPNAAGYDGFVYSSGGAPGVGQHGSMSENEMNNTLIARGPSFKLGARVTSPTGNADIAPTVLSLLDLPIPSSMDGRVITEAMVNRHDQTEWKTELRSSRRSVNGTNYRQTISLSRVGDAVYLDFGKGWRE